MKSFEAVFGGVPAAIGHAPGRVNLLGEHTDYNDGFVLPIAIPQQTHVAIRRCSGTAFSLYSATLDRTAIFALDAAKISPRLASHLALQTEVTVDQAKTVLEAALPETGARPVATIAQRAKENSGFDH